MTRQRILIVEDDSKTAQTLRLYLEHAGFAAEVQGDGRSGLAAARSGEFDLLILDLMLPGLSGQSLCQTLRLESQLPILMLTARSTTEDRIEGLELGADDYVTKPFSPREVVARVRTILRRTRPPATDSGMITAGALELDCDRRRLRVGEKQVELTAVELAILAALMRARGRVLSREALIQQAFGDSYEAFDRTIDAHVMKLRKKIEPDRRNPVHLLTVYGTGYRISMEGDDHE
jgi:DNA-binding response OmpR family regulator